MKKSQRKDEGESKGKERKENERNYVSETQRKR